MFGFRGTKTAGGCPHDPRVSGLDLERAVFRPLALGTGRIDHESPGKALPRPELLLTDLMAERTGHAIRRETVTAPFRVERKMRENLAFAVVHLGLVASHRHMALGTLVLDGSARFG